MLLRSDFRSALNYSLAAGSETVAPLLRGTAKLLATGETTEPASWRRGLLLGAAHIGDVLYRSASLSPLQRGLPASQWSYLAERGSAEVLRTHPAVAEVIESELPRIGSRGWFALARQLRSRHFDAAIAYDTGGYWPSLLLAAAAGIPNRVGYVHKGFSGLVTHPISIRMPQPYSAYFRDLVATLTRQLPDWSLRPAVITTSADVAAGEIIWRDLGGRSAEPMVACFVTTRQPRGQWKLANYGKVIRELNTQYSTRVLLLGSSTDRATLDQLVMDHQLSCPIITTCSSVLALIAFLRHCEGVFCPDSGPRHLANAARVPVCFMRNLWPSRVETGAYLETELDLAPDSELVTPGAEDAAFRGIIPERVAERIAAHLRLPRR